MKTKNMKRAVLGVVVVVLILVSLTWYPLELGFCRNIDTVTYSTPHCLDGYIFPEVVSSLVFYLGIILILFSIITYRLKDEVFTAWWSFARWWVPVIIGVTLLLGNMGGGGTLGMNKDFTAFILIILYSIFIITSLVKIVRTYLRTK